MKPSEISFNSPDGHGPSIVGGYRVTPGVELTRQPHVDKTLEQPIGDRVWITTRAQHPRPHRRRSKVVLLTRLLLPRRPVTSVHAKQTLERQALIEDILLPFSESLGSSVSDRDGALTVLVP